MNFTDEQMAIIKSNDNQMVVNARAGSGKTTTLLEYVKHRPSTKFLYLVFNKKMKSDIDSKLIGRNIRNLEVRTIHSFVMRAFKNKLPVKNLNVYEISKRLSLPIELVKKHINVYNKYLYAKEIKAEDFLETYINDIKIEFEIKNDNALEEIRKSCFTFISTIFVEMENEKINRSFDWFIKRFQMLRNKVDKYDSLLVDEAQDISAVMLDILQNQLITDSTIFIGDSSQQIYGWRGAVDSLKNIEGFKEYQLTNSFRVGKDIEKVVKDIFNKNGIKFNIQGLNEKNKIVDFIDRKKPFTYIARTNSSLVLFALQNSNKKVFIPQNVNFDTIDAVFNFFSRGDNTGHQELKNYSTYNDLKEDYEKNLIFDNEVILSLVLVEEHKYNIPDVISDLKYRQARTEEEAEIILTTAHSSKGLEYEQLIISNDFIDCEDFRKKKEEVKKEISLLNKFRPKGYTSKTKRLRKRLKEMELGITEELNIKYVAYTRGYGEVEIMEKVKNLKDSDYFYELDQEEIKITSIEQLYNA